jgi:hypothetical protein
MGAIVPSAGDAASGAEPHFSDVGWTDSAATTRSWGLAGRAALGREPLMQPAGESRARKCKEKKGKKLAFPWIPFFDSRLINGLERKK